MQRRGYTLMELMIVAAIMVIAAGIAVPIIRSMLSDSRQSSSGDTVRAQLAETRARAMDEGRPWRLAYLPGTGIYQFAPEESPEWSQMPQYPDLKPDLVRDALPEGVIFGATKEEILSGGGAAGTKWITIATYLPAGNARPPEEPPPDADAQDIVTTYFGQHGFMPMRVEVRALTGTVDVQQVLMTDGGTQ